MFRQRLIELELGCLFFGFSFVMCCFISLDPSLLTVTQALAASAILLTARRLKIAEWHQRLLQLLPCEWEVRINNAYPYILSDLEYAQMQLKILNNADVYISQAKNILGVFITQLNKGFRDIALGAMLLALLCYFIAPHLFHEITYRLTTGDVLGTWIRVLHSLLFIYLLITSITIYYGEAKFSFNNEFKHALATELAALRGAAVKVNGGVITLTQKHKSADDHVRDHLTENHYIETHS